MFTVIIAGHLGKDPETRFTPSGQKVTSFTVATNQRKGKEDVTVWVRVTVWGDRFDKLLSYLKKGSGVIVTGRMNPPSSYTDKEGRTQVTLEVTAEMIEFSPFGKNDRSAENNGQGAASNQGSYESPQASYHPEGQFQTSQASQYGRSQSSYGSQTMDEDALPF